MKEHYKHHQSWVTTMEWIHFLERHKLPNLTHKEIEKLNSPFNVSIEWAIKTYVQRKIQTQMP